jgi:hypothetical protein
MSNRSQTILAASSRAVGSLWVAVMLAIVLAALLVMAAADLHDTSPRLPQLERGARPMCELISGVKIQVLVSPAVFLQTHLSKNEGHAFYTKFFVPPPAPVPKPTPPPEPKPEPPVAPPPPQTRKVQLLFQGVYETAAGEKKIFLKRDEESLVIAPGAVVAANWAVAAVDLRRLTLTNAAAQTNILEFNSAKALEIPVK